MNVFHRYTVSILLLFLVNLGYSQTQTDTLKMAQSFSANQEFEQAISLLIPYHNAHPNDVYTAQLLANCLQWNQQYNEAEEIYISNIKKYPNADFLVLDFARMKYQEGEFDEAKPLFESFLKTNPKHIETLINLGYISYWNGTYKKSENYFNAVLTQYPNNPTASGMMEKIHQITRPYIALGFDYGSDSQPLNSAFGKLEAGWYQSSYFQPVLNFDFMNFSNDSGSNQIPWVRISNQTILFKSKTQILASVGISKSTDDTGSVFSGSIELTQKLTSKLSIALKAETSPYFYSLASVYLPVSFNGFTATGIWRDAKTFNGQVAFIKQYFMDDNDLTTFYFWGVSRSFGFKPITFNVGYSYNFQNSKNNSFQSILTLPEIIQGGNYENIEGIYLPYFTPKNQNIHGLIGVINVFPEKKLNFELKGNIGLYAFASIPYLYLQNDDVTGDVFIAKDYYLERKTTMELSAKINFQISNQWLVNASYIYTDNFFYTNNLFNVNLKYRFK